MSETRIGKIQKATFGFGGYQEAQFGLTLIIGNSKENWSVSTFEGFWGMSPSSGALWTVDDQRARLGDTCLALIGWMKDANVTGVSQLGGIPVEVTFDGNMLESWRVLTEAI